jgi:hypothetical protein
MPQMPSRSGYAALEFLAGQTGLALENMYLRKAVTEGRRKFKTLFDVVDVDGIEEQLYVHDLDYNLIIANTSKLRSHHLTAEQIAGQKCYQPSIVAIRHAQGARPRDLQDEKICCGRIKPYRVRENF